MWFLEKLKLDITLHINYTLQKISFRLIKDLIMNNKAVKLFCSVKGRLGGLVG